MANGVYIPMSGAMAAEKRLEVVANNVANANTPGFRQQRVSFESFLVATDGQGPTEKGFVGIGEGRVDLTPGAIATTGNPLDVALDGPGFFTVQGEGGTLLTRNGALRMQADGTLVDGGNLPMLGKTGAPIRLRPDGGQPSVGSDGSITQDGTVVASLGVVTVDPTRLQPVGDMHLRAAPQDLVPAKTSVVSGALESSNMNPVRGLVELVQLTQDFQTQNRVMNEYRKLDQKTLANAR
jgi:flagellar basal-body rod protein FlgF